MRIRVEIRGEIMGHKSLSIGQLSAWDQTLKEGISNLGDSWRTWKRIQPTLESRGVCLGVHLHLRSAVLQRRPTADQTMKDVAQYSRDKSARTVHCSTIIDSLPRQVYAQEGYWMEPDGLGDLKGRRAALHIRPRRVGIPKQNLSATRWSQNPEVL